MWQQLINLSNSPLEIAALCFGALIVIRVYRKAALREAQIRYFRSEATAHHRR
jgi:hypothetical protein